MCGIAGFVQRQPRVPEETISAQLRLLEHRGPDSSGFFSGRRAAVGQTRLAVIDLITGDPPIQNEDQTVGVALNGEIYNFRSLQQRLRADGHQLKTDGDTEVIAHLAERLAPADLARSLDGMFGFAVWDENHERLILGRDRLGKKPLYYWHSGDDFVFASEIKALLVHPKVPDEIDPEVIPEYLRFGYVPSPRTFYRGIRSVPAGHVLVVERDMTVSLERYWAPPLPGVDAELSDLSFSEMSSETRRLLEAAVSSRLISDVPLGAFLSGGIDSSAVVGVMSALMARPPQTFTIGFEDSEGFDERTYARLAAKHFGTDHTEFVVQPDAVELIEELVWHHDQPFGDSSAIPTYLLSRLTRQHVTVALSGDGGDELFAGYERFGAAILLARLARLPGPARRAMKAGVASAPPSLLGGRVGSAQRLLSCLDRPVQDALLEWMGFTGGSIVRELTGTTGASSGYEQRWQRSEGADLLDRLLHLNLGTYLVDDLLVKVDRMSMAHALEVRSPLLDHRLVEFAFTLPRDARIKRMTLKRVLKDAVADFLPPELLSRRKRGFGVPLDRWFRTDLKQFLEQNLCASDARLNRWISPEGVARLVREHERGAADHGNTLWTLLTLEVFLRSRDV